MSTTPSRNYRLTENAEELIAEILDLLPDDAKVALGANLDLVPFLMDELDAPGNEAIRAKVVAMLRQACAGLEEYGIVLQDPSAPKWSVDVNYGPGLSAADGNPGAE